MKHTGTCDAIVSKSSNLKWILLPFYESEFLTAVPDSSSIYNSWPLSKTACLIGHNLTLPIVSDCNKNKVLWTNDSCHTDRCGHTHSQACLIDTIRLRWTTLHEVINGGVAAEFKFVNLKVVFDNRKNLFNILITVKHIYE